MKITLFLIYLYLIVLILSGCTSGEEEEYLLPEGYVGTVYIIFDQKTGIPPKYDEGKRLYEIPANGILRTQFNTNEGWHGIPIYYYIDSYNKKLPITFQLENKNIKKDSLQVCCIQNGNGYKESNEIVKYERFFIGNQSQIDSAIEKQQLIDVTKYAH